MKFEFIGFKDFKIPFNSIQNVGKNQLIEKEGSYLQLKDSDGNVYLGELPVLRDFLPSSLAEIKQELSRFPMQFEAPDIADWNRPFFGAHLDLNLSVQATFSLENALFNFYYPSLDLKAKRVRLIMNSNQLKDVTDCKAVKIKINRNNIDKEIEDIKNFIAKNPNVLIRLDANRSLTSEQLQYFWSSLEDFEKNIEFFEEPTKDFPTKSEIPLARDESFNPNELDEKSFFVIKPTLHLGIVNTFQFINNHPDRCVLSSTYETSIGLYPLFYLSQFSQLSPGLDTLSAFGELKEIKVADNEFHLDIGLKKNLQSHI